MNYLKQEISKDKDGKIWVNVGFHLPLVVDKGYSLSRVLATSACVYVDKFN